MRTRLLTMLAVTGLLTTVVPTGVATAAPEPAPIGAACDDAPRGRFDDVRSSDTHARAIDCIGWWGVTQGTGDDRYQPGGRVSRDQMASFVARTIDLSGGDLPGSAPDAFSDDDGNTHEPAIDQLSALDVVGGVGRDTYAPERAVSRGQMASFLARAWEARTGSPLPTGPDAFPDDDGDTHEDNIDRVAAAGLTGGTAPGSYGPSDPVTRAQMGTFLARFLAELVADGYADAAPADPVPLPTPAPEPSPSGRGSMPDGTWANCTEAREAGATPVLRSDSEYHPRLDADGDGVGCES